MPPITLFKTNVGSILMGHVQEMEQAKSTYLLELDNIQPCSTVSLVLASVKYVGYTSCLR